MKKSLLAVALLSVVGSANAAEIYAADGLTLNLGGEAEIKYFKDTGQDDDALLETETASISAGFGYEVSELLVAGAYFEIDGSAGDADISDLYVYAVINDSSTISVGDQSSIYDDAGIGGDYEFGLGQTTTNIATGGTEVIKYSYDGGEVFYAGLAYIFDNDASNDDYQVDGKIGMRSGDADFTLFGGQSETGDSSANAYTLEARYVRGDLGFAATYGLSTSDDSGEDIDSTIAGLAVVYDPGEFLAYSAGWSMVATDNLDDVNGGYVNATYYFSSNVSTYAELGFTDEDDSETGYVIGMDVTF